MKTNLLLIIVLIFIYGNTYSQPQFQNGGFENWEDIIVDGIIFQEPVDWSSIKSSDIESLNNAAPEVWGISDDAHTGNHSLYLENIEIFGIVATGTITNGRVHASFFPDSGYVYTVINDEKWHSVFNWRPDSVAGWYKANPAANDFGTVKVVLHTGELSLPGEESNMIAMAFMQLPSVVKTEWTRFSIPFEYYQSGTPDYYLSIFTSGNGTEAVANSEVWYDDLEFIYNNNSVGENKFDKLSIYSSNGNINIDVKGYNTTEIQIIVNDLMGRQVYNERMIQGENLQITDGISKGVYVVSAISGNDRFSTKVVIN